MTEEQRLGKQRLKELQEAAEPLIKHLCEKHHPHRVAIVTQTGVQVMEGVLNVQNVHKYLLD